MYTHIYIYVYIYIYIWQCPIDTAISVISSKKFRIRPVEHSPDKYLAEARICLLSQWADYFQNDLRKSVKLRLSIFQDPSWIRVDPIWKLLENL